MLLLFRVERLSEIRVNLKKNTRNFSVAGVSFCHLHRLKSIFQATNQKLISLLQQQWLVLKRHSHQSASECQFRTHQYFLARR